MCRIKVDPLTYDSPHVKTFLLLQAHFSRLPLPNTDFATDTKSVLDQSIRVLQAMIDIVAERGWLVTTLQTQLIMQCIIQARWYDDPVVLCLPHVEEINTTVFHKIKTGYPMLTLPGLKEKCLRNYELLAKSLRQDFAEPEIEQIYKVLCEMPTINIEIQVRGDYLDQTDLVRTITQPQTRDTWTEIHASLEYTIVVNLHRLGVRESKHIYAPKFPKGKDEGWFLTLGCQNDTDLIAMKRIVYRSNRSSHQLCFTAPAKKSRVIYTLYFISDGYIGFDQQYDIQFEIIEKDHETQENYDQVYEKYDKYDKYDNTPSNLRGNIVMN